MPNLRVVIMASEIPNTFVGQGLEKDLCVQGTNVSEIKSRMFTQLKYHSGQVVMSVEDDGSRKLSENNIATLSEAPRRFFEIWDATDGATHTTIMY